MKFQLKDKPLAVQVWVILGIFLGLTFLLLTILIPFVLRRSFTNEIYTQLEESQEQFVEEWDSRKEFFPPFYPIKKRKGPPNFRLIHHIYFDPNSNVVKQDVPTEFFEKVKGEALQQKVEQKRYFGEVDKDRIMYVILKVEKDGEQQYIISYIWERYRSNLVRITLISILAIIIFVLSISWVVSIYIAKRLTKPLTNLEKRVKEIAERNWDQPVLLDRSDEIGRLGEAIEWMRCQLIEQNQKQQAFLQNVSHELKTPIMIIRSYIHSIQDGIYPGGNLETSLKDIEDETDRLENRVRSLLHLSKLEYLSTHRLENSEFNLTELLQRIVERFSWKRTELNWDLHLDDLLIQGDKEKLNVVLENLFDNQIRYAKKVIKIDLSKKKLDGQFVFLLRVWNDGPQIDDEVMTYLFAEFKKGNKGDFGLGLAIIKRIIDMHHGQIWVANEDGGVAFYIQLFEVGE